MDSLFSALRSEVEGCSDLQLMAETGRLAGVEREGVARLLVFMGEVDARGLFREQACSSMFAYAVGELRMSEAEAYLRIGAARLVREFPAVLGLLVRGEVNLSTLKVIGPHLNADNQRELLERVRGRSKREVEVIAAELAPKPDVPSRLRPVRSGRPARSACLPLEAAIALQLSPSPTAGVETAGCSDSGVPVSVPGVEAVQPARAESFVLEAPRARGACVPLRPGRFKLEVTTSQETRDALEQLQHLLRHQVPNGDLAVIVERAVKLLLIQTRKQRFAELQGARASVRRDARVSRPSDEDAAQVPSAAARAECKPSKENKRYVPRAVLREVHARDGEQCTFRSADGKRCAERGTLELHHMKAFGKGGATSTENLQLVCRAHNGLFADQDFGAAFMRGKRPSRPVSQPQP